jgi:uncharacterized protein YndB with AHSA1/START domain
MNDTKLEWGSFTKRIILNKNFEDVYKCWTIPELLTEWFLEKADYLTKENNPRDKQDFIQSGDTFTWKWHNWDILETGEVFTANGKDKVSFSFGAAGNVHINLKTLDDKTEVVLIQDKIPVDDQAKMNYYCGCSTGWTFWLTNLKAWLEYGLKLNATGLAQSEVHNLVNS